MTKESGYMIGLSTRHLSGGFRTDFHIKLSRIKADLRLSRITWMDPYGKAKLDDLRNRYDKGLKIAAQFVSKLLSGALPP